ncbi:hypothetical protein GCM10027568_14780 [Humibacter soli]
MLAAAGTVASAALAFGRLTPTARDTLWAEDGKLFLAGAEQHGLLLTFVPYSGYLQTIPRIIAAGVVGLLPVSAWALAMTVGSCLVAGVIAVTVFFASRAVVPPVLLRVVLAAVTVLLPLASREVLGNTANLHSVLMWGLFWLVLARPASRASAIAFSVFGLFAALSEIQAVFVVPLLIIAWRRPFGRWLVVGPAVGVAAQVIATLLAPRGSGQHVSVSPLSLAEGWIVNGVMPDLAPLNGVGGLLAVGGILLGLLVLVGVAALAVVAWQHATRDQRIAIAAAAVLSPVIYALSVIIDPGTYYDYASMSSAQLAHVWLARYGVVPGMLLMGIVIVSAAALGVERRRSADDRASVVATARASASLPARAVAALAVLGVVASLVAFYVPSSTRRSDGPAWSPQVAAGTQTCELNPQLPAVDLHETLGWLVPVQCDRLAADD